MEGGRIVQTGTGRDIVERPANEYVAEFVRHVNPRTAIKGGGAAIPPRLAAASSRVAADVAWRSSRSPRRSLQPLRVAPRDG